MMPILFLIVMHLVVIQKSNAQFDPVVKPKDNSATITFPTEPWRGCGLRNVGGIGMGSTSTPASVRTHLFHFSVKLIRNRSDILFCDHRQVTMMLNLGNFHGQLLSSMMGLVGQFVAAQLFIQK